jgi:hypothetical protein
MFISLSSVGEDDLTFDQIPEFDWESLYQSHIPPHDHEIARQKRLAAKAAKAAAKGAAGGEATPPPPAEAEAEAAS